MKLELLFIGLSIGIIECLSYNCRMQWCKPIHPRWCARSTTDSNGCPRCPVNICETTRPKCPTPVCTPIYPPECAVQTLVDSKDGTTICNGCPTNVCEHKPQCPIEICSTIYPSHCAQDWTDRQGCRRCPYNKCTHGSVWDDILNIK